MTPNQRAGFPRSFAEFSQIAESLGHSDLWIEDRGNGYHYARCSCGYIGTRAARKASATGQLIYHVKRAVLEPLEKAQRHGHPLGVSNGAGGPAAVR